MPRIGIATAIVSVACLVSACSSSNDATPSSASAATSTGVGGHAGAAGHAGAGTTDASTGGGGAGGQPEAGAAPDSTSCPAYKPNPCGDICSDPKVDPDHCGSCANKCAAGAPCDNGVCGTAPSTLVPSAPGCDYLQIALADGRLYWTDHGHGTVASISTAGAGASPASLASGQKAPRSLLIAGGAAYWINGGDNTVMKASLGEAGAATPIVTVPSTAGDDAIGAIAVDGTTLYYAVVDKIYETLVTGGAATLVGITQQGGVASALAFDTMNLYYPTKLHNDVEIMALAPSADGGSQTSRIAESQGGLYFDTITVIGGRAYWANNEALRSGSTNHGVGTINVTTTANYNGVTAFAIGTTYAYLAEGSDGPDLGFVEKAPLDTDAAPASGAAAVVARGQKAPNSIALDATKVYWATRDVGADAADASGCTIMGRSQ